MNKKSKECKVILVDELYTGYEVATSEVTPEMKLEIKKKEKTPYKRCDSKKELNNRIKEYEEEK